MTVRARWARHSGIFGVILASCGGDRQGRQGSFGFRAMGVDGSDRESVAFFVTTVCFWSELDDSVKGDLDVGKIGLREVVEVCVQTT